MTGTSIFTFPLTNTIWMSRSVSFPACFVGWVLKYAVAGSVISARELCAYVKGEERRIVQLLFQRLVSAYINMR